MCLCTDRIEGDEDSTSIVSITEGRPWMKKSVPDSFTAQLVVIDECFNEVPVPDFHHLDAGDELMSAAQRSSCLANLLHNSCYTTGYVVLWRYVAS